MEPFPYSLSTLMEPPISPKRLLVIARPRPLPSMVLLVSISSRLNLSKRFSRSSSLIPIPVSVTSILSWMTPSKPSSPLTVSVTVPSLVYLTALFKIFTIICLSLISSPNKVLGRFSSTSKKSFKTFCSAFILTML